MPKKGMLKKQSQSPAGGCKSERRIAKLETSYLKKQSQFGEWANGRKPLIWKGLWKYAPLCGVKKQSQFAGQGLETSSTDVEIRNSRTLQRPI